MSEALTELYALLAQLQQRNTELSALNIKLQSEVERIGLIRGPCDECKRGPGCVPNQQPIGG